MRNFRNNVGTLLWSAMSGQGMHESEFVIGRNFLTQHSFIHSFLGRWANHDHLTSSLKHIINQTNI